MVATIVRHLQTLVEPRIQALGLDAGLLVLRAALGLLMAFGHGWGKMTGFGERAADFPDPIGVGSAASLSLAVFAEVFCALALVVGVATRLAAVPLLITMLVAAGIIHADDPFRKQEFALLYAIPFLALILTGPGRFSVDGWLVRRYPAA